MYWNNPSETYIDVSKGSGNTQTRWISESGAWDLFIIPGPTAQNVFRAYTSITGTQALPPKFALGYVVRHTVYICILYVHIDVCTNPHPHA